MSPASGAERRAVPAGRDRQLAEWLWLALPIAALGVFAAMARRLNVFIVDDVFISLRYGRHLLDGLGLVYNPGQRVEGYTNFLQRVDVDYLLGRRPDLIVMLGRVPQPHTRADFWLMPDGALFEDTRFRAGYGYSARYEFNRGYYLLVYRGHGSLAAPADFWGGDDPGGPAK